MLPREGEGARRYGSPVTSTAAPGRSTTGRGARGPARPGGIGAGPIGLVLTGIVSVQVGGAFAATLFSRVGPAGAVVLRLVFAAAVLLVRSRPHPRRWSAADLRTVLVFGATLGVMNLTFYEALARLPLGAAVTLEVLGPLTVAVVTGRRLRDAVWAVLAFCGVLLLGGGGLHLDPLGVLLALTAGACWGVYILASGSAGRRFDGQEGLVAAMLVAAVLVLPFGVPQLAAGTPDLRVVLAGFAIALLSSVVPYSLELIALRSLVPAVFGVLMSVEPAVAALAGFVVLHQHLGAVAVVAIVLVMGASAGAALTGRASAPLTPD